MRRCCCKGWHQKCVDELLLLLSKMKFLRCRKQEGDGEEEVLNGIRGKKQKLSHFATPSPLQIWVTFVDFETTFDDFGGFSIRFPIGISIGFPIGIPYIGDPCMIRYRMIRIGIPYRKSPYTANRAPCQKWTGKELQSFKVCDTFACVTERVLRVRRYPLNMLHTEV